MTQLAWLPQQRGVHRISQNIHDAKWPCGLFILCDWLSISLSFSLPLHIRSLFYPFLLAALTTQTQLTQQLLQHRHGPVVI